jgi:hypothetical protein
MFRTGLYARGHIHLYSSSGYGLFCSRISGRFVGGVSVVLVYVFSDSFLDLARSLLGCPYAAPGLFIGSSFVSCWLLLGCLFWVCDLSSSGLVLCVCP